YLNYKLIIMLKTLRTGFLFAMLLAVNIAIVCAQPLAGRVITGTVTDEDGGTLPGASVMVKGTKIGATTDINGKFTLSVPAEAKTLVIKFIGMAQQEVSAGSKTVINVSLKSITSNLNEVVVVGYGTVKRANLTSAQTTVTNKELNRTVNTTIEQAIQGRSAGVYITQNSGQPGGGISVNIRGVNSLNGSNEPLYVIDGVQIQNDGIGFGAQSSSNPLSGLNPADIEDIQVLQGPSATSIYGSRATNGVLLITTKRGKAGDVKINYGYQHSIQSSPNRLTVMNLQQYAQMVKEFHGIAGGEVPIEFMDPSLLGAGTDWQKELFTSAPMDKHSLSLSGGSDKTTYYLSSDYLDQNGVATGSGFKRASFRLNLDNKPKEWITLGANLSFNQTNEVLTSSQENVISNAIQLTPQVPVKNIDGTWGGGDVNNGANQFAPVNPIAISNLTTNTDLRRQFLGGLNLGVKFLKDFSIKSSFNTNLSVSNSKYYIPTYKIGWAENVTATFTNGSNQSSYWNWNQQLDYSKKIKNHNFSVMATHEAQESNWRGLSGRRTGFLTNDILDLAAGSELSASNSGGSSTWGMESYLGRVNYDFADKYIVSATFRADGSANFGPDKQWGYFPSVSLAWRVTKEKFFNVPAISELKLRFETGTTGNQGGSGGIYSPLSPGATPTGTGFLPSRYGNPGLQWEDTKTDNVGINIGFLNNKFQLEADYYVKNTNNLLMGAILPWYMGSNGTGAISAPTVNIGSLENKGWGITLNTTNISSKNFKWSTNINISHFKTKIKKFNSDNGFMERSSWWLDNWTQRSSLGESPWLFRGYIEEGIFQSTAEIDASAVPVDNNGVRYPTNVDNIWVGDVKYKDISGPQGTPDGKIDVNDITNIGNPWPKLFGGLTNSFTYKGFDLSFLLTSTYGNDVYNYMARANTNPNNINLSRNLLIESMDYARPIEMEDGTIGLQNPGTNVARISYGPNGNYSRISNKFVEDGSFIRLKNISLAYSLPNSLMSKQKLVRSARLMFGAQNIATITGYKGFDPEVGAYVGRDASAGNQAIGLDNGRYPLTPIYTFSLGLDF
ncbi:MAG: TonB-dependent receptor plug, partial [Daejeonella sp.]|nr:TonB-dependent receptor plug [Daejeonella sp.]